MANDTWVAGCGGTETPFKARNGHTLLYMWNGKSEKECEHAYYDVTADAFLTYDESDKAIWG